MVFTALCLTVGLVCWGVTTVLVMFFWRYLRRPISALPPAVGADCLFLLEILPFFTTAALLTLFVIPAFSAWEPVGTSEGVNGWMAAASTLVLATTLVALKRLYTEIRNPLLIREDKPFVAVLGCVRQTVVVTQATRDLLTEQELTAVLRHESAHVIRRDNFRLFAARLAAMLTLNPCCWGEMESARKRMSEFVADSTASVDEASALDLAQALVKIARHFPAADYRFASSLVAGGSGIQERVLRLFKKGSSNAAVTPAHLFAAIGAVVLTGVLTAALQHDLQFACYQVLEKLVSL